MPELPEVESFVQALKREYAGRRLKGIRLHRRDLRYPFDKRRLKKIFAKGETFLDPQRVAKQMVLRTEAGMVAVSLGMSGSFLPSPFPKTLPHEHVTLLFEDGSALAYIDPRRFGFWLCVDSLDEVSTAADPLNALSLKRLFRHHRFSGSQRSIKEALMDQSLIGGLGNIYALEALFRAGISPLRACASVKPAEFYKLAQIIPPLLQAAIEAGGSTVSTYRRLHGDAGGFQENHLVYGRDGEQCLASGCKGTIRRSVQSGRGSWWCPRCQK
jgi:formamidopyrimidine-DNA glycosylase